jgi:hypothetical protein
MLATPKALVNDRKLPVAKCQRGGASMPVRQTR